MPLYQMFCITAHYEEYMHIKSLVRQAALHVMHNAGVVRKIQSQGTLALPQPMRRHKHTHNVGDYWTMHFDAAPSTVHGLRAMMRRDPRVLRWSTLRLGHQLERIAAPPAKTIGGAYGSTLGIPSSSGSDMRAL